MTCGMQSTALSAGHTICWAQPGVACRAQPGSTPVSKQVLSMCGMQTDVIKGAPADPSALVASQLGLELYELGKEVRST